MVDSLVQSHQMILSSRQTSDDVHPALNTYFGGVDVSFPDDEQDEIAVAVYVILDGATKKVVYEDHEFFQIKVPYIPSFLAFREIEPLVRLIQKQRDTRPDLTPTAILVDGNGILHPRGAGIASFLGVRTGIATIGVGKTLFYEGGLTKRLVRRGLEESLDAAGEFADSLPRDDEEQEYNALLFDSKPICGYNKEQQVTDDHIPNNETVPMSSNEEAKPIRADRGEPLKLLAPLCHGLAVPLVGSFPKNSSHDNDLQHCGTGTLACALVGHGGHAGTGKRRAMGSNNPIYISIGHNISLRTATAICASLSIARIPESVRQADLIGREMMRKRKKSGTF